MEHDAEAIRSNVLDRFERNSTRGLALFSSTGAGFWQDVELSRPVRNQAVVAPHPDLLQLEAILETYESFCMVLVDSEKARIFLAELGRIEEQTGLVDDVPGRHDQGGWSQARYQRHVDDHRQRHFKHTADVLFRFFKRREFDHLILAGQEEMVSEFEKELHDYLRKRILARINLPMTSSTDEILASVEPGLRRLNRGFERSWIRECWSFAAWTRPARCHRFPARTAGWFSPSTNPFPSARTSRSSIRSARTCIAKCSSARLVR